MRRPGSAKSAAPGATSLVAPEEILGEFFLQGRKSGGFYFKTRKTYGNKKVAGCQSAKPKHLLDKTKIILLGFGAEIFFLAQKRLSLALYD